MLAARWMLLLRVYGTVTVGSRQRAGIVKAASMTFSAQL